MVGAPVRRNGRLYNCGIAIARGTILGAVPKTFLPNYREYYEKRWFASGGGDGRAEGRAGRADGAVRHRSDLRRRGPRRLRLPYRDLRGLLGADPALHPGRARRRADPHQSFRLQHHDRQGGRAQIALRQPGESGAGGLRLLRPGPGRKHHRSRLGRAGLDLRARRIARRDRPLRMGAGARRRRRRRAAFAARTDAQRHVQRRRPRRRPSRAFVPHLRLRAQTRVRGDRLRAEAPPLPLRSQPARPARPGLLRGVQYPGAGPGPPLQGDERRASGDRRLGRARFDPCPDRRRQGLRPARPAARDDPRLHHARLRHRRGDQGQCLGADERIGHSRRGDRHPPRRRADARRHGPPLCEGGGGLRRHLRKCAGGAPDRLSVPPRQPALRLRRRHRRFERDRARLVDLRGRRPDEPLRRQCRRAQDADPVSHPLGDQIGPVRRGDRPGAAGDPRHQDFARIGPRRREERDAIDRGKDRPLRAARFLPVPHIAPRFAAVQGRLPRLAGVEGRRGRRMAVPLSGRAEARIRPRHDQEMAGSVLLPLLPAQPVQALGASPTAPRFPPAGRSARAATGARRATAMRRRGSTNSRKRSTSSPAGRAALLPVLFG